MAKNKNVDPRRYNDWSEKTLEIDAPPAEEQPQKAGTKPRPSLLSEPISEDERKQLADPPETVAQYTEVTGLPDVAITGDRMTELLRDAVLGTPLSEDAPFEEQEAYAAIRDEVEAIQKIGGIVELPPDIPEAAKAKKGS